ncbi:hypothetical protein LINGRAHAP2_LOCUS9428 [Linum grandiflorum]
MLMGYNWLGRWVLVGHGFNLTRWQQLLFLPRILTWIINMRPLFCSSRSFAAVNRKSNVTFSHLS